jgi:predicted Zn finger-like uncharacterized protein
MLTRCPACDTTFRVGPEQLKARQGRVRCGQCNEVFSALDTLLDEVITVAIPVAAERIDDRHETSPPPWIEAGAELPIEQADSTEEIGPFNSEPAVAGWEAVPPEPTFIEAEPEPEVDPDAEPAAEETPEPADLPATEFVPELHDLPATESTWRTLLPVAGISLAITALLLQALMIWRIELATVAPATRPALEAACDLFGCAVGLPSKADLLSIESSDLHPHPTNTERLVLNATLRNRAPFAQTWPHLELTLTDMNDRVLARRVLAPKDYLPADEAKPESTNRGIAAGADAALELHVSATDLAAGGYRLYVFYP